MHDWRVMLLLPWSYFPVMRTRCSTARGGVAVRDVGAELWLARRALTGLNTRLRKYVEAELERCSDGAATLAPMAGCH